MSRDNRTPLFGEEARAIGRALRRHAGDSATHEPVYGSASRDLGRLLRERIALERPEAQR